MGIRLRFPVSFGLHEFSAESGLAALDESLQTVTLVPGVELEIPVSRGWTLIPFADLGAGKDLEGGAFAMIYGAGMKAIHLRKFTRNELRTGVGLRYDGSTLTDGSDSVGYATIEAGIDIRRAFLSSPGNRGADFSIFAIRRRYTTLGFEQIEGGAERLRNQNEVGFTLGVDRPYRWWLLKVDRVGMGFRFGGRLTSVRIVFDFPF